MDESARQHLCRLHDILKLGHGSPVSRWCSAIWVIVRPGVAVTRNPSTDEKLYYGEFLVNAQGERRGGRYPHAVPA